MDLNTSSISVKQLVLKKLSTPTMLAFLSIVLFSLCTFELQVRWSHDPFRGDVNQYYSYLVAQFIHHDFSFHFPHDYWLIGSPTGDVVPKVTMGMAALYFPFFVIANNIAYLYGYDQLGYSAPYVWCIHFGTLVYVLTGFWYLRKTLLLFFSEWVSAVTLVLILTGTNLFYYTYKEGEMTHSYLFFLFSLFIYHSISWQLTKKSRYFYVLCFFLGFITLIRPSEIIIVLLPLLYQVGTFKDLALKLREIIALKWKLLLGVLVFLVPLIPQLLFWKRYTGQFLFFSYGEERFFFNDPRFYSVLLGWHKGWFIYTPLAVFMVVGLILMYFKWRNMFFPIAAYLLLNIYLISSWWDWGFGGAYGMRALVQCYALLAIPLAFFIQFLFALKKQSVRIVSTGLWFLLVAFFVSINGFHFWLAKNSILHWDSMSREAYKSTFFKSKFTAAEWEHLQKSFIHPDYKAMRKGIRDER